MKPEYIDAVIALVGGEVGGLKKGPLHKLKLSDSQTPPTEEEIQTKLSELVSEYPMKLLREERNRLLSETDWWAVADRTMTSEQTEYRTALRDLPANSPNVELDDNGNLINVTWPTKPE